MFMQNTFVGHHGKLKWVEMKYKYRLLVHLLSRKHTFILCKTHNSCFFTIADTSLAWVSWVVKVLPTVLEWSDSVLHLPFILCLW